MYQIISTAFSLVLQERLQGYGSILVTKIELIDQQLFVVQSPAEVTRTPARTRKPYKGVGFFFFQKELQ